MRPIRRIDSYRFLLLALACLLAGSGVFAETEIYRCELEDGTFSFQEMPCVDPAPSETEDNSAPEEETSSTERDDTFDFVNPFDQPEGVIIETIPAESSLPPPISNNREECEKLTRDAIDAIDLEMRSTSYSASEGKAYLAELRQLTQQLRSCKQL